MNVTASNVKPDNATDKSLKTSSDDDSIATVVQDPTNPLVFKVHLAKAGSTQITVKSTDGGKNKTLAVTVKEPAPATTSGTDTKPADSSTSTDKVPTADSTVAEIKAYLDKKGIKYASSATKPDLLKLIPASDGK